jgi:CheY-like chemotaxis protein
MSSGLERIKILVVDDNTHMIKIVKTILRGFDVKDLFDASTAEQGFEFFRGNPVDLIITDFVMNPLNGCDFVRKIRTDVDSPNTFVPIIMLTAYAEKSHVEMARDSGITEFCVKPVTALELYRKVCAVINTPRSFVRTKRYFGPDRRRRDGDFTGEERRENA